jgi:hypothetical protein
VQFAGNSRVGAGGTAIRPDRRYNPDIMSVANFTGKGRWESRLPDILAALEALRRARRLDDGFG